jgi:hypothetical protein
MMCYRNFLRISMLCILAASYTKIVAAYEWTSHTVQQYSGSTLAASIPAQMQVPTLEMGWNRPLWESQMVYMPDNNQLLISTVGPGVMG